MLCARRKKTRGGEGKHNQTSKGTERKHSKRKTYAIMYNHEFVLSSALSHPFSSSHTTFLRDFRWVGGWGGHGVKEIRSCTTEAPPLPPLPAHRVPHPPIMRREVFFVSIMLHLNHQPTRGKHRQLIHLRMRVVRREVDVNGRRIHLVVNAGHGSVFDVLDVGVHAMIVLLVIVIVVIL
jgi:hypothetical protein